MSKRQKGKKKRKIASAKLGNFLWTQVIWFRNYPITPSDTQQRTDVLKRKAVAAKVGLCSSSLKAQKSMEKKKRNTTPRNCKGYEGPLYSKFLWNEHHLFTVCFSIEIKIPVYTCINTNILWREYAILHKFLHNACLTTNMAVKRLDFFPDVISNCLKTWFCYN